MKRQEEAKAEAQRQEAEAKRVEDIRRLQEEEMRRKEEQDVRLQQTLDKRSLLEQQVQPHPNLVPSSNPLWMSLPQE